RAAFEASRTRIVTSQHTMRAGLFGPVCERIGSAGEKAGWSVFAPIVFASQQPLQTSLLWPKGWGVMHTAGIRLGAMAARDLNDR
ncbi:MAG: hypothetical protein Q4A98_11085, partial [Comamonadaceae bacterium]|nr:hypothetical protein [Comamonadaceae bacterium]